MMASKSQLAAGTDDKAWRRKKTKLILLHGKIAAAAKQKAAEMLIGTDLQPVFCQTCQIPATQKQASRQEVINARMDCWLTRPGTMQEVLFSVVCKLNRQGYQRRMRCLKQLGVYLCTSAEYSEIPHHSASGSADSIVRQELVVLRQPGGGIEG